MLEMRWTAVILPSCSLISPEGLSITRVGAEGVEGEEKAYCDGEAWTLMSRNGRTAAAMVAKGSVDLEAQAVRTAINKLQVPAVG